MALLYFNAQMCGNKGVLADARFLVIQENFVGVCFCLYGKSPWSKIAMRQQSERRSGFWSVFEKCFLSECVTI